MAAHAISLTGMARQNPNAEVIEAVGDIKTLLATKFGELNALVVGLQTSQVAMKEDISRMGTSVRELRADVTSMRSDKVGRNEIQDLDARFARDIMRIEKSKIGHEEFSLTAFEALGELVENLGARIDGVDGKVDQILKIEGAVQKQQLKLDQMEVDLGGLTRQVEPLKEAKWKIRAWQAAAYPVVAFLAWLLTHLFKL